MFAKVTDAQPRFLAGEHACLRFWESARIFDRLREKNADKPNWSFLDGPITANNPMGVHHAWGRTYKDAYQRFFAMKGHRLRYQNGFDCQGLWVEVEVEKELNLGTKTAILEYGIDKFVNECKKRVLRFAARQTEQSRRLGYWMDWDDPDTLRLLADKLGTDEPVPFTPPSGKAVEPDAAHRIVEQLGNPEWGGSYFTFSTENNETIWSFLKKCHDRGKIYRGHDVMPWGGRAGSAYSQMEIADGRKLTTHKSVFVRFPLIDRENEFLLVWTTTPWTLTSNVAAAVNPDLDYVKLQAKRDGAIYYFAKDNLDYKRLETEFKEGFGRPEWKWPKDVPKLKTIAQIFKENGGYEVLGTVKGREMENWRYRGPFDDLDAQLAEGVRLKMEGSDDLKRWTSTNYLFDRENFLLDVAENDPTDNPEQSARDEHRSRLTSLGDTDSEWASDEAFEAGEKLKTSLWAAGRGLADECRRLTREALRKARSYGVFGREVPTEGSLRDLELVFNSIDVRVLDPKWGTICALDDVTRAVVELGFQQRSLWSKDALDGHAAMLSGGILAADTTLADGFYSKVRGMLADVVWGLVDETKAVAVRSAAQAHRVIDGGRDSRGNAHVVAGEGTGIVHIAPGCGDVDNKIGAELGLPVIAPLKPDGTYDDGFGPFTGREAIDPETAQLVFDELKRQDLLVAVEVYPHVYPHCWRTGEELVFRLVDEWFVNMDWRDEIKDVTRAIEWLPDSIDGEEREVEWLTNMRDWMISKKRVWGLALPFWINPDDPTDFEVMGSLAELKERAIEGWDVLEANTPHRPWIDAVKIKSKKTGATLERIPDVGNPWLDAGIVPFSTLNYNERYSTETLNWADWYPADLVTECFPGQFRNWFYSMLSLGTMTLYDDPVRKDDPAIKRPFKTLLGHRLVMDEDGRPMHKSDGTAIWFEEAAEQLGVDTLRWMYLAQNPAQDLRFGLRHPEEPVTLETPEGPISETREGLPTVKVTSTPADEIRRKVLIPLYNSYKFFVNFAAGDGFDPTTTDAVPVSARPENDRWLLSRLHSFLKTANDRFAAFDAPAVCAAAEAFIGEDLSKWYIRRNKARFWSKATSEDGGSRIEDRDKAAAYQTLYDVLLTLSQALAPAVPFLAEVMYQNLAHGVDLLADGAEPSDSVHLCDYPVSDESLVDTDLERTVAHARRLVGIVHTLRSETDNRVRQTLAEVRFATPDDTFAANVEVLSDVVRDELNVKAIVRAESLDDLATYTAKPNLKTLGPKYGKLLGVIKQHLPNVDAATLAPLRAGETVNVELDGNAIALVPEDVMFATETASGWAVADDGDLRVALNTELTPELVREGMARDFIRQVQQQRGKANLDENAQIVVRYASDDAEVDAMIGEWGGTIRTETRASSLEPHAVDTDPVSVGDAQVAITIEA